MGGTGVSTLPDLASVYTNPGALSFLYSNGVMLGSSWETYDSRASGLNSNSLNELSNLRKVNLQAFGAWAKNSDSPIRFGLGIYDDFGARSRFELRHPDFSWRHDYSYVSKAIQPSVSYRLTDRLGVGLGLKFLFSDLDWKTGNSNDGDEWLRDRLEAQGAGVGLNLGMYWSPSDAVQIGFNYRSSVGMDSFNGTLKSIDETISDDLTLNLSTPMSWSLGMNFMVKTSLAVAVETEFVGWSGVQHNLINPNPEIGLPAMMSQLLPVRNNQWQYKVGLEYAVFGQFQLRTGVAMRSASVVKGSLLPIAISNGATVFSWGAGYYYQERLMIDLSFQLVTGSDRTQTLDDIQLAGHYNPDLDAQLYAEGLYGSTAFIPSLTISLRL